jgi:hypothetical protein
MRLLWNAYLELYAQMIMDRTNERRHIKALLDEHGF